MALVAAVRPRPVEGGERLVELAQLEIGRTERQAQSGEHPRVVVQTLEPDERRFERLDDLAILAAVGEHLRQRLCAEGLRRLQFHQPAGGALGRFVVAQRALDVDQEQQDPRLDGPAALDVLEDAARVGGPIAVGERGGVPQLQIEIVRLRRRGPLVGTGGGVPVALAHVEVRDVEQSPDEPRLDRQQLLRASSTARAS